MHGEGSSNIGEYSIAGVYTKSYRFLFSVKTTEYIFSYFSITIKIFFKVKTTILSVLVLNSSLGTILTLTNIGSTNTTNTVG